MSNHLCYPHTITNQQKMRHETLFQTFGMQKHVWSKFVWAVSEQDGLQYGIPWRNNLNSLYKKFGKKSYEARLFCNLWFLKGVSFTGLMHYPIQPVRLTHSQKQMANFFILIYINITDPLWKWKWFMQVPCLFAAKSYVSGAIVSKKSPKDLLKSFHNLIC